MRTCPDCQSQLDDRAVFCDNCGLRVSEVVEPQSPVLAPAMQSPVQVAGEPVASIDAPPGTCSSCGYVNVLGEMFCQNCGVQLAPVASVPPPPPTPVSAPAKEPEEPVATPSATASGACGSCGYVNAPGETFCQNCGFQLQASSAAAIPPAPQSVTPEKPPAVQGKPPELETWPKMGLPVPGVPPSPALGKLVVQSTGTEIQIPAGQNEVTMGRSDPVRSVFPDIDLSGFGGDSAGVSRMHARLFIQGTQIFIEDLNSTNYSFLNKQRLQPGRRYPVTPGDEIRLGLLVLDYVGG